MTCPFIMRETHALFSRAIRGSNDLSECLA
jgi:hypothetical protein